jgi:hypothetical protein
MRIAFRATEAAFEAHDQALICGVAAGPDMYLTFQRAIEGSADDDGIYLEHRDQINGQYGCISTCRVGRTQLSVDLTRQLGALAGVKGFDVALAIDEASYEKLCAGLQRIFHDHSDVLIVA